MCSGQKRHWVSWQIQKAQSFFRLDSKHLLASTDHLSDHLVQFPYENHCDHQTETLQSFWCLEDKLSSGQGACCPKRTSRLAEVELVKATPDLFLGGCHSSSLRPASDTWYPKKGYPKKGSRRHWPPDPRTDRLSVRRSGEVQRP